MRPASAFTARKASRHRLPATAARALLVLIACAALAAGFLAIPSAAAASADPNLTGLLRSMAILKVAMAACATAAVLWRLGTHVPPRWLVAYAVAGGAMWTGPGLIWSMVHVGTGALLLHGGLLATLVLLWRDPAVGSRLAAIVTARREAIRAQHSTR